jgi:hypothetical protein
MQILTRYFEVAGFGNERSISRVLAIPFDLTGSSAAKLAQAGIITRNCKIEGLSGPQTVLSRLFS